MMWWMLAVKAGKVNVGKLRLKTIQNLRLQQVGACWVAYGAVLPH